MNYELSLWFSMPHKKTENNIVTNEWSREVKSGILANSDYKTPFSAYDIALEEKINGDKSLTFTMPSRYYDVKTETYKDNPFTTTIAGQTKALLTNGSLLKLKTDKGVHNFVIDEITKNSENNTYSYSCSNSNLLQLARSGYNIELNTELENNMGTVIELGEKVVDGVDWHVVDETGVTLHDGRQIKSDIIQAWLTQALYAYTLRSALTATNLEDDTTVTIASGQTIFISSDSYTKQGNTIQFLWVNNGAIEVNEQLVITNSPNYKSALPFEWSGVWPTLYATASYRGKMLNTTTRTKYIPNIDKICNLYTKSSNEYYGYSTVEYATSETIQNMISENTNIVDINDWTHTIIDTTIIEKTEGETTYTEAKNFAQITYYEHDGTSGTLYYPECTTINSCKAIFEKSSGFSKSIHYYFCYKPLDDTQPTIANVAIQARSNNTEIASYTTYYTSSTSLDGTGDLLDYKYFDLTTATDLSYNDVVNSNIKLVLTFTNPGGTESKTLKFTDIKFFQVIYDSNNNVIVPDISKVVSSIIRNKWYFFPVNSITDQITSINQLIFSDICYEKDNTYNTYIPQTNSEDHYELITSIEVKESNRFNIIQSLCEKFECWTNLYVDTNDYGESLYKYQSLTSAVEFVSGKQYYVVDGTPTGDYFDDIHFKYANLNNIFSNTDADYYYDKANKYYKKVNDMWVRANLGHQWGEHFYSSASGTYPEREYYTLTYVTDEGVTTKQWDRALTYNAGQTYYIKDNQASLEPNYERVSVGNQFATDHTQYYVLSDTWYANLYQKYYSKFITFNEYTGKLNLAGFKYGINLAGITRKLDSSNLVTKLIVADNTNEYAANGYCSIIDAKQNALGSNALYNFSYYLGQGLINKDKFQRDMYGEGDSYDLAYATKYGQINNQSINNINEITELTTALIKLESQYSVYGTFVTQAHSTWTSAVDSIQESLASAGIQKTWNDCADPTKVCYNTTLYNSVVNNYIKKRDVAKEQEDTYHATVERLSGEVDAYNLKLNRLSEEQAGYAKLKEALDYEFHQRYQNYVREGTWSSDDYYDPEQYYFDANDVLLQSSFPTISYTFNVEDLSDLEGWRDYNFSIGDKTYVRDTEFFKDQDSAQMEVIISAITWQLDRPWDTSITVQNYTTEFQDLFSKMEAATQVLQYNEAKYEKAGTMATDQVEGSYILSNILSNNTNIITTADGKFTYDNNGITAIDANTKYQLKLTSRGLVLSKDGGATWSTGISGQGINAEVITTGTLNVDNIQIYGGASNKQFEWDKYGINAYTGISGSNLTKYVRFCKHGLYGTSGMAYNSEFTSPAQIINSQDVSFALTWEGMVIRSNRQNGTYAKIEADSQTGTTDTFTLPHYEVYSGAIPAAAGITVYEFNNSSQCYIVTSDTSRQLGKTYYQVVSSSTTLKRVLSIGKTAIVESYTQDIPYFVVYEDGTLRANNGIFNGIIECQDIRNKSGASMLNSNDTIKYSYLDLGGIVIDGPNSQITIKSAVDASANTPSINITNSALNLRGALIHMYSQNTAGGNRNYARISFHNQYDAETSQQYGYVGAGSAVMGTGTSTQTGIVISSTDTDDYSGDTAPYFCVSSDKTLLYNHGRYLLVKTDGVYFNNGDGEHLVGTGGGSGGGTAIAVFG